ncbi:hypothetical protein PITCH_A1580002 [uncultured Desulfobacterium sp.]|uniref:Uncharacterized protein n=1 Tax=uncultured Desulfobacterium sp. TaxID=201089 RepID=A0A445MTM6_9BACT|nr:hypothetical protein PITCH_A1580002 [uncultured Desulfobacterium sp.]
MRSKNFMSIVFIYIVTSFLLLPKFSIARDLTALEDQWFLLNIKLTGYEFSYDNSETTPKKFSSKVKAYLHISAVIFQSSCLLGKLYVLDTFEDCWTPGDFEIDVFGGTDSDFIAEGYGTWTDSLEVETINFQPDFRVHLTMNGGEITGGKINPIGGKFDGGDYDILVVGEIIVSGSFLNPDTFCLKSKNSSTPPCE